MAIICLLNLPASLLLLVGCRDPTFFPLILTFLRDGRVPLPDSALERAALRQEAEFYALTVSEAGVVLLGGRGGATVVAAAGGPS